VKRLLASAGRNPAAVRSSINPAMLPASQREAQSAY